MKELYFLPETIHQNSLKMLQKIRPCPNRRTITFNPNRSALLILDMQQYFLRESSHAYIPSAQAIIPGINELIKIYSARDLPIIFTRHINSPQNAKMMALW
jgi:isochorismate hydrolase